MKQKILKGLRDSKLSSEFFTKRIITQLEIYPEDHSHEVLTSIIEQMEATIIDLKKELLCLNII